MKFSNTTKLLCLFLSLILVMGCMVGCQQSSDTFSNTSTSPSSDDIYITCGPYEPEPSIADITIKISSASEYPYYSPSSQWAISKIALPEAWEIVTGSSTVRVGVIDSGIDITHPGLEYRINTALSESFVDECSPLEDQYGHGTHVAGIIGAQGDNEIGISGVCQDIELVSLRVCDNNGTVDAEALINAIESANNKDIDILNISINIWFDEPALTTYVERLETALSNFDGLIVCSSGNANPTVGIPFDNDTTFNFPSNFHLDNLLSVGASTNSDLLADFSCFGDLTVDLFAPGVAILSCYPTELCCSNTDCDSPNHSSAPCDAYSHSADGYHLLSGTSMAAPHVAGVAALLLSIHPELTAAELKEVIMNNVDIIYDEDGNSIFADLCVSGGRLNAYKALTDASIHNFGRWTQADSTYHKRTCSTCGYAEYGLHKDSSHPGTGLCLTCGYSGASTASTGTVDTMATAPVKPELALCA